MKTKLDRLLEKIDPAVTIDRISSSLDQAFNSFSANPKTINTREEFKTVMASFYCHVDKCMYGWERKPDSVMDWHRSTTMLEKEYGSNGENIAYDMARTNIGGGLYAVLKAVTKQIIDEYSGNQIGSHVSEFWNSLSVDEKIAVSKEYLDKFGHLIPSDLRENGAVRVRAFFWKTLEEHPRIIKRLRNLGKL